ncbi:DUF423 domain-containing protein [Pelagibius sp.]|uniref:DUF423 domain-containing protein n=1 Tax=Pelagibius sp. TaxID=1931238 RepID=UPI003B508530
MMMRLLWIVFGLLGAGAVALGAYGSHGAAFADAYARDLFDTALRFHFLHLAPLALAALTGSLAPQVAGRAMLAALALVAGMVLFSGTLYLRSLGLAEVAPDLPLPPAGGFALMAGWLLLAWAGLGSLTRR